MQVQLPMSKLERQFSLQLPQQHAGRERSPGREVLPQYPFDAVIWDSGGVLVNNTFPFIQKDIITTLGLRDNEQFNRGWSAAYPKLGSGEVTLDEFWEEFRVATELPSLALPEGEDLLARAHMQHREPIQGSLMIKEQLKVMGFVNVVLSNSWPGLGDAEAASLEGFDEVFLSHKIKARKPKKSAFDPVIEYLEARSQPIVPQRTLFIDDQEKNMAAREFGLYPVLFSTPEKLAADLNELGIPVNIDRQ